MNATSHFKVQIPTKPYIKKYLESVYGNPIVFYNTNYFGTTVLSYLQREVVRKKNEKIVHKYFDKFTEHLVVFLPMSWLKNKYFGVDFTRESVINLNKHMEERFEEDLVKYCHLLSILGVDIQDSLEDFCRRHNIEIEEDITFDALKQKEFRARIDSKGIFGTVYTPKIPAIQQIMF